MVKIEPCPCGKCDIVGNCASVKCKRFGDWFKSQWPTVCDGIRRKAEAERNARATVDCHDQNDRFVSWMQNQYMKSDYTESMDFPEYLWRYGAYMLTKWEAINSEP